ncbi:MAG: 2-amino-4-ketopentanoate thiolase [Acholeplasmataceae bacterium]|jgi:hypothetical protein|nr:2-amino-4-ketopentanoate thiolase [Acholeplasmataceae bacterium]
MILKGTWVQIRRTVLLPAERAKNLPADTKSVPLEMWVKGWLLMDADCGEEVRIRTRTGREENGKLVDVNPSYHHDYGDFVPEILQISEIVKSGDTDA